MHHCRIIIAAVMTCFFAVTAAGQTRSAADSSVKAIRSIYEKGSYLSAEVEARRFLEQRPLADSLRITAEQYLAFALVAQGKANAAVRHFTMILEIDSTFELDPVYTSPKILASFNEAKQLKRTPRRDDTAMRRDDAAQRKQPPTAAATGVSWRSLVFPGWEQVHQGRETKGYALLGAGTVAAGLSVVFQIERSDARRDYLAAATPDQATSRYDRYNRASKAGTYSIMAFAAIYLYSELDAFLNLPEVDAISVRPAPGGLRLSLRL